MVSLTLSPAERDLLEEVLHEVIADLRMEIADTDAQDYRMRLHAREELLKGLVKRLSGEAEIKNL
jgi:vacuolar-type H+-ATPase subunit E/Vma4